MAQDQLLVELSADREKPIPFANSTWNFINDQSNGNYSSGQSTVDTSSLANNAGYLHPASLTYAIPWGIRVKGVTAAAPAFNTTPFMAGLKSWWGEFLHSFTADLNTVNIIQQTPYLNVFQYFKLLTTMSYDDLRKDGSLLGLWPDSSTSWNIQSAASTAGFGIVNNTDNQGSVNLSTAAAGTGPVQGNEGFFKRQQWICYNGATAAANPSRNYAASAAQLSTIMKSAITTISTDEIVYRGVAIIPLYTLNSLFSELPLMKGSFFRFQIQLNQSNLSFTLPFAVSPNWPEVTTTLPYGGGTNCLMLASRAANNGAETFANTAECATTVDLRIGSTAWSDGVANAHPFGQIRLYYRMLTMQPAEEAAYAASAVHRVRYRDIYQYTISGVASGASPSQLLFNAVSRPRELLMVPIAAQQTIGAITNPSGMLTAFDSSPCTTCPMAHISQFQVQLSGATIFPQPITYGFSEFLQELRKTGVNYGSTEGLCSGLIGFEDFMNNYAYVYVNLESYGLSSMDDISKSVQVSFTSQSALTTDWYCYVSHERELELNVLSGQIISYK